ncbi:Right handed beta helix region [Streptomyces sp. DvalAA-14]|nr:discoidin domain-containing protein [Streptomyces sp. SID4948]SCE10204.1 Right handed beta helix region [Streptomyces sp. DvalAA-14]
MTSIGQQDPTARHRMPGRRGRAAGAAAGIGALVAAGAVSLAAAGTSSAATISGDLACGKAASATSTAAGTAAAVTDCDTSTSWQSSASTPQELKVDLGATTGVDHVTVAWGAGYATTFKVRTSANGTSWHTETQVAGGTGGTQSVALPAGTATRWIELYAEHYASGAAGFTVSEFEVFGAAGTTTPPPTSPPTTPPTTPPTSPPTSGRTVPVSTAAQLTAALADARPGDTIKLADGTYAGQFTATVKATAAAPVVLTGSAKAVLTSNGGNGYGLWLNGAPYWQVKGITVANSTKGIVMDASPHVTLDGVSVHDIGYEGVHFRSGSDHGLIQNSDVHDTGTTHPDYGEGVYIGSANSNWGQYAGPTGVDASDYVQVLNNTIGPNVAAEGIDIKEGTHDGVIRGNTLDGTGEKNQNSGDSTIDVKGDNYVLDGNVVSNPYTDGFQVHNVYDPYGCGNTFTDNKFTLGSAPGYGINVTDNSGCATKNTVSSSNTDTGGKGLTNIAVTP